MPREREWRRPPATIVADALRNTGGEWFVDLSISVSKFPLLTQTDSEGSKFCLADTSS